MELFCVVCKLPLPQEEAARGQVAHKENPEQPLVSCKILRRQFIRRANVKRKLTPDEYAALQQIRRKGITPEKLASAFPQRRKAKPVPHIDQTSQQ